LARLEVCISAGMGQKEVEPRFWRVSKIELVGQLQVLFQSDGLKIAGGLDLVSALTEDLTNFRMRAAAANGNDTDAWREGSNDDLVFAAALATWRAQTDIPPSKAAMAELDKKLEEFNAMMARSIA